ncbi:hypothetical protein CSUI_008037 [Cystoisospora suis]|uniref:Uncharacterized protein n=1 Tax=Cystoisospora suis TaxID=483139 RepID=A0A2C6KLY2_9APIC|nr:hypothetical protein CSUI_008037 [Cystoisospora suis]
MAMASTHLQTSPGVAEAFQTAGEEEEEEKERGQIKDEQDVHMTEVSSLHGVEASSLKGERLHAAGEGDEIGEKREKRHEARRSSQDLFLRVSSSEGTTEILLKSLAKRKELRQAIVEGDAVQASAILERSFPLVLRINQAVHTLHTDTHTR